MREEIKYALYMIATGVSIVAYAHTVFAPKELVVTNSEKIARMDERIYEMWKVITHKQ